MSERTCLPLAWFIPPAAGCDPKTYTEYVCKIIADQLTHDETRLLMEHYSCRLEELVDHIVADKMGTAVRKRRRKVNGGLYG